MQAGAFIHLLGGALVFLFFLLRDRHSLMNLLRHGRGCLVRCTLCTVFYLVLLYLALGLCVSRRQVIEISLINYLWPASSLLFSLAMLKYKARSALLLGLTAAAAGIFIGAIPALRGSSAGTEEISFTAYVAAFAAALAWGPYSAYARRESCSLEAGTGICLFCAGLAFVPLAVIEQGKAVWTAPALFAFLYLAFFATALAYVFWTMASKKGDLVLVISFSYLGPVLSTLVSILWLRLPFELFHIAGALLVGLGAFICRYSVVESSVCAEEEFIPAERLVSAAES